MQTYVVQTGDTLFGISKQFGVNVDDIKKTNGLSNDSIKVGEVLSIPTVETTSLYIVKKGDTLYSIAAKYNTTVSTIIDLNNLSNISLSIGQQLRIPINEVEEDNNYITYIVSKGDTLYSIASIYGVSVESIKNFNNLLTSVLSIGQKLLIPTEKPPSIFDFYTVKSGDTLYSIASKYGISTNELISLNSLTSNVLKIGQILKVPSVTISDIPIGSSCYGKGYVEPTYITYTVKKGDSLYSISKKYSVSVDSIIKLNNLKTNNLSIGQVLKIKEE